MWVWWGLWLILQWYSSHPQLTAYNLLHLLLWALRLSWGGYQFNPPICHTASQNECGKGGGGEGTFSPHYSVLNTMFIHLLINSENQWQVREQTIFLTCGWIPQLLTDNKCVLVVPITILSAYTTPHSIHAHLHCSFLWNKTTNQLDCTMGTCVL